MNMILQTSLIPLKDTIVFLASHHNKDSVWASSDQIKVPNNQLHSLQNIYIKKS